jgi:MYXO-CTERM domain-containing protein
MQEIACESESECPDGWTCEATAYETVTCKVPEGDGDADCAQEPAVIARACLPPFNDVVGGGDMWETWGGATSQSLGGEAGEDAKAQSPEEAAQYADDGAEDADVTDLSASGPAPGADEAEGEGGGGDSGCSVAAIGAGATGSALPWLAVLALLALRRRRRG